MKDIKYGCIGAGGIADNKHLNGYSKLEIIRTGLS